MDSNTAPYGRAVSPADAVQRIKNCPQEHSYGQFVMLKLSLRRGHYSHSMVPTGFGVRS